MQNIFIINQKAGKGQLPERFLQDIEKAKEQLGANADVYYTKGIGDAEIFSRKSESRTSLLTTRDPSSRFENT